METTKDQKEFREQWLAHARIFGMLTGSFKNEADKEKLRNLTKELKELIASAELDF